METYLSLTKSEVEGGMLQVRKKLWKGVVRRKSDEVVVWKCKHNHSRPEFNSRYVVDYDVIGDDVYAVWETSALNCGRAAYQQWGAVSVTGEIGAVGNPNISIELRPDMRFARVGDTQFQGRVELNDSGQRVLTVSDYTENAYSVHNLKLNLDIAPKKGLSVPSDLDSQKLPKYLTAMWLLKGGVWGVVFQDHSVRMEADGLIQEAIEELMGEEKQRKPKGLKVPALKVPKKEDVKEQRESTGTPRLEISSDGSKRVYEVITADGEVKGSFFQRGRAVAALEKLR